jgi:hypothetical protein
MKTIKMVATFFIFILFSACSNEESSTDENDSLNDDFTFDVSMTFGSQTDAIPSNAKVIFDNTIVGDNYDHMWQKSKGINCGSTACLAVSYLMGRQILQPYREFSVDEVNNLRERMHTDCGGIMIDEAVKVAKVDFGECNSGKFKVKSTSSNASNDVGRTKTKDKILEYLEANKPIIARVEVKKNGSISTSNAYTHFVVIVGLTLTDIGTGSTVYYIDPLKQYGEVLDCRYTDFLNSMRAENNYYYLLPLGCI